MIKFNMDIEVPAYPPYRMYSTTVYFDPGEHKETPIACIVVGLWVQATHKDSSRCFARITLSNTATQAEIDDAREQLVCVAEERFKGTVVTNGNRQVRRIAKWATEI